MTTEESDTDLDGVPIRKLSPAAADMLRTRMTQLGLHKFCSFKPCLRQGRCATRHALCWQASRDDINAIIMRGLARAWRDSVARGEEMDVAPLYVAQFQRILAQEGGACGIGGSRYCR